MMLGYGIYDCFTTEHFRLRQCHFKIWLDCHKFQKFPCLIMPMSTKCQKNENKMTINVIQHDDFDIYDCFTTGHFQLFHCQQTQSLLITLYINECPG
jgi:hypothetical protein